MPVVGPPMQGHHQNMGYYPGGQPPPKMGYGPPPPQNMGYGPPQQMSEQVELAKKRQDFEDLCRIINQWNANRLDLFALTLPNEVRKNFRTKEQAWKKILCSFFARPVCSIIWCTFHKLPKWVSRFVIETLIIMHEFVTLGWGTTIAGTSLEIYNSSPFLVVAWEQQNLEQNVCSTKNGIQGRLCQGFPYLKSTDFTCVNQMYHMFWFLSQLLKNGTFKVAWIFSVFWNLVNPLGQNAFQIQASVWETWHFVKCGFGKLFSNDPKRKLVASLVSDV